MTALDMFPETRVDPTVDLDRRYTTPETMDLCMRTAGVDVWDFDVAADEESHWAPNWYSVAENGLKQTWAKRCFCNPPFSGIEPWVVRAWEAMTLPVDDLNCADLVAMLLPANRTEQPWWHRWVEPHRDGELVSPLRQDHERRRIARLTSHFLPTRVRYGHPGNARGVGVGSPPFASVLLVWRFP